jgi:hypothetical protein
VEKDIKILKLRKMQKSDENNAESRDVDNTKIEAQAERCRVADNRRGVDQVRTEIEEGLSKDEPTYEDCSEDVDEETIRRQMKQFRKAEKLYYDWDYFMNGDDSSEDDSSNSLASTNEDNDENDVESMEFIGKATSVKQEVEE